ncbi:HAD family phosphatase [Candidatus Kaiserbacteria bacterium]|nr:HAD family phosphatase [Candidatus Kaiserbacteria bacterium]
MSSEGGSEKIPKPIVAKSVEKPKPALAFDLEGTLVDLERFHQMAFEHVAAQLGLQFGQGEFHAFVGAGDEAIAKEIARLGDLSNFKLDPKAIRTAKTEVYRDMLHAHPIVPREGAGEYLERAKIIGGNLVLASLTPDKDAERILTGSHLKPFFTFILTESDVQKKKPDPEVYQKAAKLRGVVNPNMLVHEDSPVGVASGKAAGSPVAAFPVHENLKFEPKPDAIYMGWKNLAPEEVIDEIFKSRTP